jgi:hypothetical protein
LTPFCRDRISRESPTWPSQPSFSVLTFRVSRRRHWGLCGYHSGQEIADDRPQPCQKSGKREDTVGPRLLVAGEVALLYKVWIVACTVRGQEAACVRKHRRILFRWLRRQTLANCLTCRRPCVSMPPGIWAAQAAPIEDESIGPEGSRDKGARGTKGRSGFLRRRDSRCSPVQLRLRRPGRACPARCKAVRHSPLSGRSTRWTQTSGPAPSLRVGLCDHGGAGSGGASGSVTVLLPQE